MSSGVFAMNWAEIVAGVFIIIGIVIAFLSPSAFISYIIIFLSGMIAGRLLWERRTMPKTAYIYIILGFLVGFMLGAFRHYGNPFIILVLFIVGARLMYVLNKKGILEDLFF